MIQYAAAFVLNNWRHGVLGRPVKPGDDSGTWGDGGCGWGRAL
jgi:hypothetical protein